MADKRWKLTARLLEIVQSHNSNQKGVTLIELVISIALMGILGMALLQGLSTVARGQAVHDERVGALVAGRAHLESIKQADYDNSVTATPGPAYTSLPTQQTVGEIIFDMDVVAQQLEPGVQLVTVVVSNGGEEITRLQSYKVDR